MRAFEFRGGLATLAAFITGLLLLFASYAQWQVRPSEDLPPGVADTLRSLGIMALSSHDVPVAAVLLYGDSIIGKGSNVVARDTSAGGHAEIEALSDAFKAVGSETFRKMNRDSLLLVTTFEPCLMCRGAIVEYNIRQVVFLKGKPIFHWLKEDLRTLRYYWSRKQGGPEFLQDSLFLLHPQYRKGSSRE